MLMEQQRRIELIQVGWISLCQRSAGERHVWFSRMQPSVAGLSVVRNCAMFQWLRDWVLHRLTWFCCVWHVVILVFNQWEKNELCPYVPHVMRTSLVSTLGSTRAEDFRKTRVLRIFYFLCFDESSFHIALQDLLPLYQIPHCLYVSLHWSGYKVGNGFCT